MTDDLTRGYEGQDDSVTESADASVTENGSESSQVVVGQAAAPVVVNRPAPGQTVEIQAEAGQNYVLNFPPGDAQVRVQGENFILAFDDDGDGTTDSRIVFLDMLTVADSGETPTFQVGAAEIGADILIGQAVALAGSDEIPLDDVAAGPGGLGTGATAYDDNLGSLIDLLVAQGVIPPVELEFGLINVLPDPIEFVLAEVEVPLLINEIGVRVQLKIPGLPGEEPNGGGGEYGEPQATADEVVRLRGKDCSCEDERDELPDLNVGTGRGLGVDSDRTLHAELKEGLHERLMPSACSDRVNAGPSHKQRAAYKQSEEDQQSNRRSSPG